MAEMSPKHAKISVSLSILVVVSPLKEVDHDCVMENCGSDLTPRSEVSFAVESISNEVRDVAREFQKGKSTFRVHTLLFKGSVNRDSCPLDTATADDILQHRCEELWLH